VSDGAPLLVADRVTKVYPMPGGDVHALRGVSLDVARGDYLALMGPSGCGKSTLLNLFGAVDLPSAGQVRLEGADTAALDDGARTRLRLLRVGFVFQRFFLLPMLTAWENIELPQSEAGVPTPERRARTKSLLEFVELADRADHLPSQLSGGEMQRVAVARALANRPALLLADEPTGELDEDTGDHIAALFDRVHAEGTAILLVTHNASLAARARTRLGMRSGILS
jgi:putative ABC transport system ATP-binding protein